MRCLLPAWIAGWVVAIFLPSLIIAWFGIPSGTAATGIGVINRLAASTWAIADAVEPAVKLAIGGLLLLGFLGFGRRASLSSFARYAAAIITGVAAILLTAAVMPLSLSSGFAEALSGERFDPSFTLIYGIGGSAAGMAFAWSAERCQCNRPELRGNPLR